MVRPVFSLCALIALTSVAAASPPANDPLVEQRLFSPDPQRFGLFGYAVAVRGDAMVIGAFVQDGVERSAGAAYVFRRVDGAWQPEAKLVAPDGRSNDLFGTSATIDGDTVVLGSPRTTTPEGVASGAAYVYRRVGGQWTLEAKLHPSDATPGANFGFDLGVALSGDTLVVGAAGPEDDGLPGIAAYVFQRRGATWTETARLTNFGAATPGGFGNAVSIDGRTIVVGAPLEADAAGAAYVFRRHGERWVPQARLTAPGQPAGEQFGFSAAIDGDTIAIGALTGHDAAGAATGAVHAFERRGHHWRQVAHLLAPDGVEGDWFGYRVAVGRDTIAVGAVNATSPAGTSSGAVHVYQRAHHGFAPRAVLFESDPVRTSRFGCSVATDGRTLVGGDGFQSQPPLTLAGEAYVYDLGEARHDHDHDHDHGAPGR